MSKYSFDFLFNVCLQSVSKVRSDILFAYILVLPNLPLGKLSMLFLIDFTSNNLKIGNQNGLLFLKYNFLSGGT